MWNALDAAALSCEMHCCVQALYLLRSMPHRKVAPNLFSYTAAISACAQVQHWKFAVQFFEEMVSSGICPDNVCRNLLLDSISNQKEAYALFKSLNVDG